MRNFQTTRARSLATVFVILGLLATVLILAKLMLGAGIVDDAYIFMRYARNIATGFGPVFNPGEPVEGYTSPLWTLLLATFAVLKVDLPLATMLLGAFFGATLLAALLLFGKGNLSRNSWPVASLPVLILATNPSFEYWAWSGMDTLVFTFLFFLTFWVFLRQVASAEFLFWSGICFFLAAFARLDILALLPIYVLFIFYFNRHEKAFLWKKYLSFLAPGLLLALQFLWRYSYYGAWLPNTYYAKTGVPADVLIQKGLIYTSDFISAYAFYFVALLVVLFLIFRFSQLVPDEWKLGSAIIVVWLLFITYVGGDHFAMFRFYVPVIPILVYLFVSCVSWASTRFTLVSPRIGVILLAILVLFPFINNYGIYQLHDGERAREEVGLAIAWVEVGTWLGHNLPPSSTIAAMVVGAVPYYSGLRTYDILGLTDREVATTGKVYLDGAIGHQKYDTDYILAQKPNVIVYGTSGIYSDPIDQTLQTLDPHYFYGMRDLVNDPRTLSLYSFRQIKLASGRYIQLLELK